MSAPDRPGWYADPLKPTTQERRWDGTEWTDETREASVPVSEQPPPPAPDAGRGGAGAGPSAREYLDLPGPSGVDAAR